MGPKCLNLLILLIAVTLEIQSQPSILVKDAIVFTGTGEEAKVGFDILIQNSRIVKTGFELKESEADKIVDCAYSKTVIPGLVNMHGHLYGIGKSQLDTYPILYLAGGVTTVFSPGEFEPKNTEGFRTSDYVGPDIYSAGPYFDNQPSFVPWIKGISDTSSIRQQFAEWSSKIFGVKVYTSITEEQFRSISKLATDRELFITGHLSSITAKFAIANGISGLEHGLEGFSDFVKFAGDLKEYLCELGNFDYQIDEVEQLIDLIVTNNVYIDPTLVLSDSRRADFEPVVPNLDFFLADSTEGYLSRMNQFKSRYYDQGCIDSLREKSIDFVRRIFNKGGTIVTGTDPVSIDLLPGYAIKREIELLVNEVGVPLAEAIKMASLNGAEILGIGQDIGSIEIGKIANLGILNGNILDDLTTLYRTEKVIKNGEMFLTEELRNSMKNKIGYGNWIPNDR